MHHLDLNWEKELLQRSCSTDTAATTIMSNPSADTTMMENLRILLDGFNAANDALLSHDGRVEWSFPRIVVIGDQSHGKSSVISRITNIRLPSKEGACTRAPLHIASRLSTDGVSKARLSFPAAAASLPGHLENGWELEKHEETQKYVKSLLREGASWPPQELDVLAAVEEATTALVANVPSGMTNVEMLLEWESPQTFTLDVVDLPGFADLAANGMSECIKDIVDKYIRERNSIILCVFGSDTADLAAFKALNAATQDGVDPFLERTLIIFTRLDKLAHEEQEVRLRQHVNDLHDTLKYKPLDVFLVTNTSNADLSEQQAREDDFLHRWRRLQGDQKVENRNLQKIKLGVPELVKRLQRLLTSRLEDELPKLLGQLTRDIERTEAELLSIPVIANPSQAGAIARKLAKELYDRLKAVRYGLFSRLIERGVKVTERYLVHKHLLDLHEECFTKEIVIPNYLDLDMWDKLTAIYGKHAGKEMRDDIDVDTRRHFYLKAFATDLTGKLLKLAERASVEVQTSYEAIVDDVFAEYSKLRTEVKGAFYNRVLKPQTDELINYLRHTAKAQMDFHSCSSIYKAGMTYYNDYIRGYAEDVQAKCGVLGLEELLTLGQKGSEVSVAKALEYHKTQFMAKADHNEVNLMEAQWAALLYTVLVHNSLYDIVPRIVRMFLVHELIDEKLDAQLIDMVGLSRSLEKLGDEDWLLVAMVEPEVRVRREETERKVKSMRTARFNLEEAQSMWEKVKGFGYKALDLAVQAAAVNTGAVVAASACT